MAQAERTIDHDTIRAWVESRGGIPARVKGTRGPGDLLRIDFPGFGEEGSLEQISWDEFFEEFERNDLAFLYQDEPKSRFNKFVSRTEEDKH